MAGNWMDDRERQIREREARKFSDGGRAEEGRSWDDGDRADPYAARRSGPDRDRVFGERESGASYGRAAPTGHRGGSAAGGWQSPGYEGVSPAMRQGGYGQGVQLKGADYTSQDGQSGGRFYGDDNRERVYREEYGQGGVEYGDVPAGYDAEGRHDAQRSATRERYHGQGYGQPGFGGYPGEGAGRSGKPLSGGTGGYDYAERGYGDAGRRDTRGDRFEDAGRSAGDFLHKASEKVASWFSPGGEGRSYDENGVEPSQGKRGLGPQGYKRSDERINEDVHERLTEDHLLDASNIVVAVAGGEVTLSGTVDNREAKHRAERLVEHLSGVAHVQNNLRLAASRLPTGQGESVLGGQITTSDDAVANGTAGAGAGQSTAGRKT